MPRIRAAQLRAFVDGNGGAGGPLGRQLLKALQVETVCHGCDADGFFLHEPEPTAENLHELCPMVRHSGAQVGFALDPDSDRLALIDETGQTLSELAAELPVYHIVKDKYTVARAGLPALFGALAARWPEARANRLDGLRLDWADRWVHVRPSNTEPIVRVIAEAPGRAEAEGLCREVGALLRP